MKDLEQVLEALLDEGEIIHISKGNDGEKKVILYAKRGERVGFAIAMTLASAAYTLYDGLKGEKENRNG